MHGSSRRRPTAYSRTAFSRPPTCPRTSRRGVSGAGPGSPGWIASSCASRRATWWRPSPARCARATQWPPVPRKTAARASSCTPKGAPAAASGIMHALVSKGVPFVLAGSIRDDGPLPEVLSDTLAAQDAMREFTAQATFAVFVATALHAIAVGNMLPAFVDAPNPDDLRPLTTICVDQTEFVVTKLRDRGTHQAYGVVTNAQDFMHVLRFYVERWEQAQTPAPVLR